MVPKDSPSLRQLLDDLRQSNRDPFLLLLNRVGYSNNIGVIARTAFAGGVNGLIFQGRDEDFFNEDTLHFSMGAIARIPLVRMGIFQALKELHDNDINTFSVQMGAAPYFAQDLSGPAAFVLGAEAKGVSETVSNRCTHRIGIPMQPGIDSLNVSASSSIIIYEKVRQDTGRHLKRKS